MLSHNKWLSVLLIGFILHINNVNAQDINIQGTVIPGACNVTPSEQTFAFEDLYTGNMDEAGTASQWVNFTVTLTDCPAATQKVLMKFSGTPSAQDSTYFANAKDALNVVLQLTDPTHEVNYSNGSVVQTNVDTSHNATYPLAARIYSPLGHGGSGDFESIILLDFTYQ
ncbi:fimbrial protein [Citrobacter amalonaticus]|uniref:fimbrial protein n=1 Tax=Citrobacter amalonaticus TaxID=35703 RepID=UPI001A350267|nr:type 1 fimbrial protein [Citrobacter amalonaticus]HDQ2814329.1 type 1 fimbrial protein [Citrobacter amalonaticus]HDZ8013669.1 type 1 fimbrial protein [Citrobacter amalonaticus]